MWLWPNGLWEHFPLSRKHLNPPTKTKFQTFLITWIHVYQPSVIPCSFNPRNLLSWLCIFTIFFSPNITCQIVDLKTTNQHLYAKISCTTLQCLSNHIPLPRKWSRFEKYFIETCVRTHKFKILSHDNSIQSYTCINTGLYHSIKFLLQS